MTITLKKVSCGTEMGVVQEGIPDMIPLESCYLGWQESLILLRNPSKRKSLLRRPRLNFPFCCCIIMRTITVSAS